MMSIHKHRIVPVGGIDGSPTKRPRQVGSLANHDIVHLIQQTISTSLEGHLGHIQDSLTNIVHDQATQSSRKRLEDQASQQQLTLGEMQKEEKKVFVPSPLRKKTVKSYVLRCLRHLLVMDSHWVTKCKSMAQTRVKRKSKKIM